MQIIKFFFSICFFPLLISCTSLSESETRSEMLVADLSIQCNYYEDAIKSLSRVIANMVSKVSSETVSPQKSIGDNLNYNFKYTYEDNYAHRLVNVGERYYQYDANGNVTVEQDEKLDGEEPMTYPKITQEAEAVYSTAQYAKKAK